MNNLRYIFICLSFLFIGNALAAKEECVFDSNYFSEKDYSGHKEIKHLSWDKMSKEARIILKSNDVVLIKHWACGHVGLDATLIGSFLPLDAKQRLIQLAKLVLKRKDAELVEKQRVKTDKFDHLDISHDLYSEFFVEQDSFNGLQSVRVKYYHN